MDWTGIGAWDLIPSAKDLYLPGMIAAIYWTLKKVGSPIIVKLVLFLKSLRYRELKKVKNIRIDKLKTMRELKKESALYTSFLLSAVISLGLLILPIQAGPRSTTDQVALAVIYFSPVFILEIMWLWQKTFVDTLIEEAAKLPPVVSRKIRMTEPGPLRVAMRQKRIDKIKKKKKAAYKNILAASS